MARRKLKGGTAKAIFLIMGLAAIIHIYIVIFGIMPSYFMRPMHMLFMLPICFLLFPASKESSTEYPSLIDYFLSILSIVVTVFLMINYARLESRWMNVSPVYNIEVILGTINVLLILEACRRAVTPMISLVASIAIVYLFLGPHLTGMFYHGGFSYPRIIEGLYLDSSNGLYGSLTGISTTYIIIFILFGSFMDKVGMGNFFNKFATVITGKTVGGPAKIAVVSSSLFGTISGSAVANVYGTGTFTIPLMKRMGYRPQFAGAVEAVASTGGQIMPPVMGAAAFIMAELTSVPYFTICLYAAIPAVLYFFSVFVAIHYESLKHNLKPVAQNEMVNKISVLKEVYYFLPLIGIIILLVLKMSAIRAAFGGILITILISLFKKETWMTPKKIFTALSNGATNTIMLAVALSCAGIIVSVIVNTGLGLSFGSIILGLSGGNILLILLFTMILAIILGCGLPSSAAYIVTSAIAVPILTRVGFDLIPSHLFVFYSSIVAGITPPVAITAYAGASVAGSDPMKTGFEASKLGIFAFLIPYAFITNSYLVAQGPFFQVVLALIIVSIGVTLVAGGIRGYLISHIGFLIRILLIVVGLIFIYYRSVISLFF